MTRNGNGSPNAIGELTFRRCDCGAEQPHGYFFDPEGEKHGGPFLSLTSALEALELGIVWGVIPTESEESLTAQIREAGMPENDPEGMESSEDLEVMDALSKTLIRLTATLLRREGKLPEGPFTLKIEENDSRLTAHFVGSNGVRATSNLYFKSEAREALERGVVIGILTEAERVGFLAQIESSALAE
jgi:hypothetical protein